MAATPIGPAPSRPLPPEPAVAYVSLYRRYRPATFGDIVGQKHVIRTLVNALEEDRLHHAYLFTGPRGTGKTSTARILAKAINCEQGPTPDPCGVCGQCTAIADGSSVDVIELDMASHGGVDDARDLRDRALFAPASARRKVYILDEVHMASTAAFNALLKLIEEPPGHVLFAMATTDPQKVLPTILSRVQRLDLRRVAADEVGEHVQRVTETEGYEIEDSAVEAVVRAGDGSVRDTLSVLEQVLAYAGAVAGGGHAVVTGESVAAVLGHTPLERVVEAVDLLGASDLAGLLALVQGLADEGHDLRRFTLDLVQHLRDLLVLQVAPDRPDLVDATDDRRRRLQAQTAVLPQASLLRAVGILADTLAEQRQGTPRLPLELALATLATPGADGDVVELGDRVARLEAGAPVSTRPTAEPSVAEPARTSGGAARPPATSAATPGAADGSPDPGPGSPGPDVAAESPPAAPAQDARAAAREAARAASQPTPRPAPAAGQRAAPAVPAAAERRTAPSSPPAPPPPDGPSDEVAAPSATSPSATSPSAASSSPTASGDADGSAPPPFPAPSPSPAPQPDPDPAPEPEPDPTPEGVPAEGAAPSGDVSIEQLAARWESVLDLVKDRSRRVHAVFLPASPLRIRNRILTLRYPKRYASFHGANAGKGEFADVLIEAIERSMGLKVRIDVVIEGDDDRRRPSPPSVTPDDARTPVLDDGPSPSEEADVREAEQAAPAAPDAAATDALLASELGAELLEHTPAPSEPT
jgi:DNA polymerase III subunit gamma/tau